MIGPKQLFSKWRRWLDRIERDQLRDLLINRHIFNQFRDVISPHTGTYHGADLARWMAQNYVAFASTAIRRLVERPNRKWQSVSLVILLEELAANDTLLSRTRFRRFYKSEIAKMIVDRDFDSIARTKNSQLVSATRIRRDLRELKAITDPVKSLVDKVVAHTEHDRRKLPKIKYGQIGDAVDFIEALFKRYSLLIRGSCPCPLVPLTDFNVTHDLKKIWD